MCKNAVDQLTLQLFRESRHRVDPLFYHLGADDDVTEKLSVICVVILRERGKFFCLSDIMEHRCRQEQVAVQHRVLFTEVIAHFYNT